MKTIISLPILVLCLFMYSCTSKIESSQQNKYPPLSNQQEVKIFGIGQLLPSNAESIKKISTGSKEFKADPNYDVVIRQAKFYARKAGGNAILVIDHLPPTGLGSPNHRMTIIILSIPLADNPDFPEEETATPGVDYAILYVYRYGGPGFTKNYNLVLGDSVICRVQNNFAKTLMIKEEGLKTIWAETAARSFVKIDFKFGKEYFLRCGIVASSAEGIPRLELVDSMTGRSELEYFK